jgi:hypothetical protein
MCIAGLGGSQTPSPAPPAPTPLSLEERVSKTAETVGKAKPKSKKKETFRRVKSGGISTSAAAKALNLTPKSSS